MIKANELRIGNILMFADFPAKGIKAITGSDIAYGEENPKWLTAFFNGVVVNEDWLLKLGFSKIKKLLSLVIILYIKKQFPNNFTSCWVKPLMCLKMKITTITVGIILMGIFITLKN